MAHLIWKAGKGEYTYCCDIEQVYQQLPLDPADWSLVFFTMEGWFYMEVTLSFGLHWTVELCQDIIGLVVKHLNKQGLQVLNYIGDVGGVSTF